MVKEIVLLILGGVVTFVSTILYQRLTRKVARIMWRVLPPVALRTQSLVAFNVVIANEGNDAASNVRAIVELPEGVEIDSCETEPSEKALRCEAKICRDARNRIVLEFAHFPSKVDCVLSFLARKGEGFPDVVVSIIADHDVLGMKDERWSFENASRTRKRLFAVRVGTSGMYVVVIFLVTLWFIYGAIHRRANLQQQDIGDLYFRAGDYRRALTAYAQINDNWYFLSRDGLQFYWMAKAHAAMSNAVPAVKCLQQLRQTGNIEFIRTKLVDPDFNPIRDTKEFQDFATEIQKAKED